MVSAPVVYVIPYFVVVVLAIYCLDVHSKRTLSFLKSPVSTNGNSAIYVKGGLSMDFLYVGALTIRIVINFLFIGSERFYFNNEGTILGNPTAAVIMPIFHTAMTMLTFTPHMTDYTWLHRQCRLDEA